MEDRIKDAANALVEACQQEREAEEERHRSRLAEIDAAEESALKIIDSAPQANPPQEPAGAESKSEESPSRPSPPPPKPPAKQPARKRGPRAGLTKEQIEAAEAQRKAVLDYVLAHPGCSQSEIADGLGIPKERVRTIVQNLARNNKLRPEGATAKRRYFHAQAPLTQKAESEGGRSHVAPPPPPPEKPKEEPAREEKAESESKPPPPPIQRNGRPGPKTELERQVVEILKEGPRTSGGISVKLKLTEKKLNPVLSGLVVRGVCRRKNTSASAQPVFELVE